MCNADASRERTTGPFHPATLQLPSTSGAPASGVFSAGLVVVSFAADVLPEYISDRELTVVRAISTTLSTRLRSVSLALVTV